MQRLKTYQRGINDGLRSWLKCQAIRNRESFSSSTECFLYTLADIGRDSSTQVSGDLKVGSKVTIQYRMTATSIEVKPGKTK